MNLGNGVCLCPSIQMIKSEIQTCNILDHFLIFIQDHNLYSLKFGGNEPSLLFSDVAGFCKVYATNTVLLFQKGKIHYISEINGRHRHERVLESGSVCSLLPDERNDILLMADATKHLVALITSDYLVLLSVDFDTSMENQPLYKGSRCILLSNEILCLVQNSYFGCSIWGNADANNEMLVLHGNGSWIQCWTLERGKDICKENIECNIRTFHNFIEAHVTWVSSVSYGISNSVAASGSVNGAFTVWAIGDESKYDMSSHSGFIGRVVDDFDCTNNHSAVCTILQLDDEHFWVGDASGTASLIVVDVVGNRLQKTKRIKSPSSGLIICIDCRYLEGDRDSLVRLVSGSIGTVWEYHVNDCMALSCKVWPEDGSGTHHSLVDACILIAELDYIVTAAIGNRAYLWSLQSGQLLGEVTSPDPYFTALNYCDVKFMDDKVGLCLWSGHAGGETHEYAIIVPRPDSIFPSDSESLSNDSRMRDRTSGAFSAPAEELTKDILEGVLRKKLRLHAGGTSAVSTTSASVISRQQHWGEEESEKGAEFSRAVLKESCNYCTMVVTDIVVSRAGKYVLFCYGRECIVVHLRTTNRAVAHLQLDQPLQSISIVHTCAKSVSVDAASDVAVEDSLLVALQGIATTKIFDAIQGSVLQDVPIDAARISPVGSTVWLLPPPVPVEESSLGGATSTTGTFVSQRTSVVSRRTADASVSTSTKNRSSLRFGGLFVGQGALGPSVMTWDSKGAADCTSGINPVAVALHRLDGHLGDAGLDGVVDSAHSTSRLSAAVSSVDRLVCGLSGFDDGIDSPFAVTWTMRAIHALRVAVGAVEGVVNVPRWRSFEIDKPDAGDTDRKGGRTKVRVVFSRALRPLVNARAYRLVTVLSDGSCVVSHV